MLTDHIENDGVLLLLMTPSFRVKRSAYLIVN